MCQMFKQMPTRPFKQCQPCPIPGRPSLKHR